MIPDVEISESTSPTSKSTLPTSNPNKLNSPLPETFSCLRSRSKLTFLKVAVSANPNLSRLKLIPSLLTVKLVSLTVSPNSLKLPEPEAFGFSKSRLRLKLTFSKVAISSNPNLLRLKSIPSLLTSKEVSVKVSPSRVNLPEPEAFSFSESRSRLRSKLTSSKAAMSGNPNLSRLKLIPSLLTSKEVLVKVSPSRVKLPEPEAFSFSESRSKLRLRSKLTSSKAAMSGNPNLSRLKLIPSLLTSKEVSVKVSFNSLKLPEPEAFFCLRLRSRSTSWKAAMSSNPNCLISIIYLVPLSILKVASAIS